MSLPPYLKAANDGVYLSLKVQPRASRNELLLQWPDRIAVRLTAPPVEGAANTACCAFLAELLDLPKSRLLVLRGEAARRKLIRIRDAEASTILTRLQSH